MGGLPEPVQQLAAAFSKLPGVGRRSALRMAMKVARSRDGLADRMIEALQATRENVVLCERCAGFTLVGENPCRLCTDNLRHDNVLCVVEEPGDILLLEEAGAFRGRYFALLGKLSPKKHEGMNNPRFKVLSHLASEGIVEEVVLALNTDVESDATAAYLSELLGPYRVKISRLASGLPAGSGLAYSDPSTLARALSGRTPVI